MSQAAQQLHDEDPTVASLAPAADGTPALIAGRYEVRDSIGRGAFGEVFEAYDRVLGRLVAVKVMPIAQNLGAEGRESLRRFQVEARAVSRLTHPNIITVHDFGQGERFAWIVMELVIGETLADALRRTGPPPLAETSRILCALLSALHAAHERGIVHRDVKPGNILLEMNLEDGLGEVRLSDFGIARTDAEDRTAVGQMIGTPWVMAPEQLRGEAVDRRTDLWAAGVILYDMLTGERPFKGTMPGIFHRIQHEEPPPPTRLRAELPPAVDALIARALAKAPEHRFATAEEMAAAIRAALTETPRWQDAPPLPGLDAESPAAGALVPAMPAPLLRPPAAPQGRFGQGIAVGMVAGIALGVAAARVMDMSAAVAVQVGPPAAETLAPASAGAAAPRASMPDAPRERPIAVAAAIDATPRAPSAPAGWMPEPEEAIRATARPVAAPVATTALAAPEALALDGGRASVDAPGRDATGVLPTGEAGHGAALPDRDMRVAMPAAVQPQPDMRPGAMSSGIAVATRGATVPGDAGAGSLSHTADEAARGAMSPGTSVHSAHSLASAAAVSDASAPAQRADAQGAAPSGEPARAPGHAAVADAVSRVEWPSQDGGVARVLPPANAVVAANASPPPAAILGGAAPQGGAPQGAVPPAPVVVPQTNGTTPPGAVAVSTQPATLPACGPDRLRIRTGSHDGHGRIVFDWSGPVAYRITPGAEGLAIAFPDAGCQPAPNGIRPARNLRGVEAEAPGAALLLRTAPGAHARDFRLGNRVVIDLADAAR